jgi:ADP-ribose pyrophosphatase YjhB (NUDIX family)
LYVTRQGVRGPELLSFTHRDFPEAGIQVPAGGVKHGEDLETAMRRECLEETGISVIGHLRALGVQQSRSPSTGRDRITVFFHAEAAQDLPESWRHVVGGTGGDHGLVFDCRFAPLADAAASLVEGQAEFVTMIDKD